MNLPFTIARSWITASLIIGVLLSACTNDLRSNPVKMANSVIENAGILSTSWEGDSDKCVFVFEESHDSRISQIEIALMFARLHTKFGVNTIALEGAFRDEGMLDSKWFHNLSNKPASEEVSLQLLREGEISAAEFATMAIPDIRVYGVENAAEYNYDVSNLNENASIIYLFAIAEKLFPDDPLKIERANELVDAIENASDDELPLMMSNFMEFVINTNDWTAERYRILLQRDVISSIEELLRIHRDIKRKADAIDADVSEYGVDYNGLIEFYEKAAQRTSTIVTNTLQLFNDIPVKSISLVIGAGHTAKTCEMLRDRGVSFVVISPLALDRADTTGDLSYEAFERKQRMLSVFNDNTLGAILDGRWKPKHIMDQPWLQSQAEIRYITVALAEAVANGDVPPFESLEGEFASLQHVTVDPSSFEIIGDNIIFRVEAETNRPGHQVAIWGRAKRYPTDDLETLEAKIEEMLELARKEGIPVNEKNGLKIEKVSRKTIAVYSESDSDIRNTTI